MRFLGGAIVFLFFAWAVQGAVDHEYAQAHLAYQPPAQTVKPTRAQVHNRQARNLHHARFVCKQGRGVKVRWHCKATRWLQREWEETRPPALTIPYPWYGIAKCESELTWNANTGNGFYGGLQFLTSTWLAYGGGRYAPRADLAAPLEQVAVASGMSLSHWPVCGAPYR